MERVFRFTTKPTMNVDPAWADPDCMPETCPLSDSISASAAQLLQHPLETQLMFLLGIPTAILCAVVTVSALFGGLYITFLGL